MKRKTLTYYHIKYGGVPMTRDGLTRFVYHALEEYSMDEIKEYIKGGK